MKHFLCLLCLFASFALPCVSARAEALLSVCINEICSSNSGHYTIEGSAPDYVELRNLTSQELALDGFFVSDDEDHLQKFSLAGYSVPGNGYLILAANKKELPFKLSASEKGELFLSDEEGRILQRVSLPPLEKDATYSLQENGEWHITEPSPLTANMEGTPYVETVYVASPRFSHEAGFYDAPFDLTLEGYKTYSLYYTTDGSVPDEHSTLYTGPIHIEDATSQPNTNSMRTDITVKGVTPPSDLVKKATIIRAVAIDPEGNRSNDVVKTYFVGFQNYKAYQNIAVLSIVADPYDLFDENDGIYVRGKVYQEWLSDQNRNQELATPTIPTNYRMRGREWEIPVGIQWFDEDNSLKLSQRAGLRIHGNWSREKAKKSFNLYARKEYEASTFQYDILAGLPAKEKLVVRANMGKDSLIHAMLRETGIPVSAYTPCLTFVNGEFWGVYEIREKQDEEDIASYFDMSSKDLLVIKNSDLVAGEAPEDIKASSSTKAVYRDLRDKISKMDLSASNGYEDADAIIDLDNYITYTAGIAYLNNSDFRDNFTMWRTAEKGGGKYQDARWRWIFQDLDNCCAYYSGATEMISYLSTDVIFTSLWKNKTFQTNFLTRIMDYANVELTPEYVKEFVTPVQTFYNPYLQETNSRYSSNDPSNPDPGLIEISSFVYFFQIRRDAVIQQFTDLFQLKRGTSTLLLNNLPEGIAMEVNGHQAHIYGNSWTGVYFTGCTVTFTAGDIPGYQFMGWNEGDTFITAERKIEISTDQDRTLTPVYEELPAIMIINEKATVSGTGMYGFTKRLENSSEECMLMPDADIEADLRYADRSIMFRLEASIMGPIGFTLSVPWKGYETAGGIMILSSRDASDLEWHVLGRNDGFYQELPMNISSSADGRLRLSFIIPEELLYASSIDIRLEVQAKKAPASFSLHSLRLYGIPIGESLAEAHEYARKAVAAGAEAQYIPDFERMRDWSDAEIEAETISLRNQLQAVMAEKMVSTVSALSLSYPAMEGLETFPAVMIDDKLIQAFYNENTIEFFLPIGPTVYIYEIIDGTPHLQSTVINNGGFFSLSKHEGIFVFLDQPVEDIRFHAAFDTEPIPDAMLSSLFFGIEPPNYIWMNIETFTEYQEETAIGLPAKWFNKNTFVYRAQDDTLRFIEKKPSVNGALRLVPTEGRYLLLDDSLETYSEKGDWLQREIAENRRIYELENQKRAKMESLLFIAGGGLFAALLVGTVVVLILRRKKK